MALTAWQNRGSGPHLCCLKDGEHESFADQSIHAIPLLTLQKQKTFWKLSSLFAYTEACSRGVVYSLAITVFLQHSYHALLLDRSKGKIWLFKMPYDALHCKSQSKASARRLELLRMLTCGMWLPGQKALIPPQLTNRPPLFMPTIVSAKEAFSSASWFIRRHIICSCNISYVQ